MKTITVKVIPNAKKERVQEEGVDTLKVWLTSPAVEGKANKALIQLLAKKYNIPKTCICIKTGQTSRTKKVQFLLQ
ncbi:MAG: DUF167 domain-containing protein [Candidatus Omnitrophica bacterium]|nr:DUF167 domain-containing protein [Candidatus Omnitrophota bacterium]